MAADSPNIEITSQMAKAGAAVFECDHLTADLLTEDEAEELAMSVIEAALFAGGIPSSRVRR